MNFLAKLLLGDGKLRAKLRAALDSEGLVLLEEGLPGSVRYHRFKAPGRRFHGKVTGERIGLAAGVERVVVYCRSGRAKLIDTPFSNPRLGLVEVSLKREGARRTPTPSSFGQKYGRTTAPYGGSAVVPAQLGSYGDRALSIDWGGIRCES